MHLSVFGHPAKFDISTEVVVMKTRGSAIADRPLVCGTLHWRLCEWIFCSWTKHRFEIFAFTKYCARV